MPRQKKAAKITQDGQKVVNHAELRVLVEHLSTVIAALEVRVQHCEACLPTDPQVAEQAKAWVADNNRLGLALIPKDVGNAEAGHTADEASPTLDSSPENLAQHAGDSVVQVSEV